MTKTRMQFPTRSIWFLLSIAAVAALGHEGAHAQQNTITGYNQIVGQWNAGSAARTTPSRVGSGSPVGRDQCNGAGESYFETDAPPGLNNWYCIAPGSPGTWTNGNPGGAGTVTSVNCGTFSASWLTCSFGSSPTITPVLTIGAATGQTVHQVIGTCGSATSFGPCSLTSSELPLAAIGTITGGVWNGTAIARAYGGLNSTSAGTGLLRDGTTPTASEISGDCTTSGSNAIACTKTNGASFAPSATTDTTNAANISTGTLGNSRLPNSTGYAVIAGNGGASTVTSGATVYYGAGVATNSGTEITRATVMPFACTLRDFILITTSTQSAGGGSTSLVATVRVALASPSSGPVINVSAGASAGPYSDSTDTATVAAGQAVDIQITNNGSGTSASIGGWSVGCVPN